MRGPWDRQTPPFTRKRRSRAQRYDKTLIAKRLKASPIPPALTGRHRRSDYGVIAPDAVRRRRAHAPGGIEMSMSKRLIPAIAVFAGGCLLGADLPDGQCQRTVGCRRLLDRLVSAVCRIVRLGGLGFKGWRMGGWRPAHLRPAPHSGDEQRCWLALASRDSGPVGAGCSPSCGSGLG